MEKKSGTEASTLKWHFWRLCERAFVRAEDYIFPWYLRVLKYPSMGRSPPSFETSIYDKWTRRLWWPKRRVPKRTYGIIRNVNRNDRCLFIEWDCSCSRRVAWEIQLDKFMDRPQTFYKINHVPFPVAEWKVLIVSGLIYWIIHLCHRRNLNFNHRVKSHFVCYSISLQYYFKWSPSFVFTKCELNITNYMIFKTM